MSDDFDAAKKRLEEMDRANLFLNHGRAKHADACWRCDEPWPCLTMRVVIDADHEWAQWHDKWIAALDLMGSQSERAGKAEAELAAERESHAKTAKQFVDEHSLAGSLEIQLAAERERAEKLGKALRGLIGYQGTWSVEPDTPYGRAVAAAREALRPAAPEAKESDCTCGEQWPCPLHGGPPAAPKLTPSKEVLSCHCTGDGHKPDCAFWMSLSEQPDLLLGHEFVAGHPHPAYQSYYALRGIFGLCGQPESAHRGKAMKENRWSTTQFDRPPMTKPRTPEEIAEEWFKIHDGMCVRSIDGQPYREHFLAALREAADAAHEAGLKLGTTLQAEAIEQARHEEREALREKLKNSRPPVEQAGSMTPFESGWRNACASNIHWLDARSCSEEPKP